ncbi:MAG: FAD-dependent oxidoreductase, partial [Rhabdochlamydiaceae bacterium]
MKNDFVVIGGGFYGCMIALHFALQGKKVILI